MPERERYCGKYMEQFKDKENGKLEIIRNNENC